MGQSTGTFGYALNSVAALGADIALTGGIVTFTGVQTGFQFDSIQSPVLIQAYVAPVGRVQTATFTAPAAVGEAYTIQVEQVQADGGIFRQGVTITSVVGSTTTTLAFAMDAALEGMISAGQIAGTSVAALAVVTTTGATTAPMLRLVSSSANIAIGVTTAGTVGVNSGTQLAEQFPATSDLVVTNNYTTIRFNYSNDGMAINNEGGTTTFVYAINEGDGDAAALVTKATEIFGGLTPGALTANPQAISILG